MECGHQPSGPWIASKLGLPEHCWRPWKWTLVAPRPENSLLLSDSASLRADDVPRMDQRPRVSKVGMSGSLAARDWRSRRWGARPSWGGPCGLWLPSAHVSRGGAGLGGWASPVRHPPKCGLGSPSCRKPSWSVWSGSLPFSPRLQRPPAAWPVTPMSAKNWRSRGKPLIWMHWRSCRRLKAPSTRTASNLGRNPPRGPRWSSTVSAKTTPHCGCPFPHWPQGMGVPVQSVDPKHRPFSNLASCSTTPVP